MRGYLWALLVLVWAVPSPAFMSPKLTQADYAVLATDIRADPTLANAVANNLFDQIEVAYNAPASPDYWVYKPAVRPKEIYEDTSASGSRWDWTTYIQASAREADAWVQQFSSGSADFTLPQTRAGIVKIFGGTGNNALQRSHILAIARRKASRVEKLFYDPTQGNGGTGEVCPSCPATLTHAGMLTQQEISYALLGGGVMP